MMLSLIRASIGQINESDISLAKAASALIYSFNIRPTASAIAKAKEYGMEIRFHNIIYKLEDEIKEVLKGKLDPVFEDEVLGQAEVLKT
jgi:translation initiation factor IF-2